MEIEIAGHHYQAPPQYGIWLPPDMEHMGFNRHDACHCSLYLSAELCSALPAWPCALTLSPLIRALLEELRRSEEHTSELQSLMRISYAVFCLKKKKDNEYQYSKRTNQT